MSISDEYRDLYSQHYADGEVATWRRIGAVGKARNICDAYDLGALLKLPRVVEIGCGEGSVAQALSELNFFSEYRGFDLSAAAVDLATSKQVPNAQFDAISESIVPLSDNCADLVVLTHVVEHLEHPRLLLAEARRLAPTVLVEVPTELNRGLADDYDWNPVGHINKFDGRTIRQLLQTCQFDVVVQFTTHPSREASLFESGGLKARLKWKAKDVGLHFAPRRAKRLFTYHETLLAVRSNRRHSATECAGG